MKVGQVIELARKQLEVHGSQTPGFCCAHLMGGLDFTPRDALFATYKDVDSNVVLPGGKGWDVHDLLYKGLILECGYVSAETYRSPEAVATDPRLASNAADHAVETLLEWHSAFVALWFTVSLIAEAARRLSSSPLGGSI
jgi:hypothetical protein